MRVRSLVLLAAATLLAGCFAGRVKQGMTMDMTKAGQLQIGTSTTADVLATLGAPS